MSRIGKKPITIPSAAKITIDGQQVTVTGPKGSLVRDIHPDMTAQIEGEEVIVTRPSDQKKHRALHGLTRALLQNMVTGVTEGYQITMEMIGVGYRAEEKGRILVLYLGYSQPIVIDPPEGIKVTIPPKDNKIIVSGIDKELVGNTAAKIRSFRRPEPYKGKGIRYLGEHVRSKAGKTAG